MNAPLSPHNIGASRALAARVERAMPSGVLRFKVKDRAQWLGMREKDVTASVAAALFGEHPYMTRLGLYALKTGQAPDNEVEPAIGENHISLPPMLRGTVLEPVVPTLIGMLRPTWQVEQCPWYYRERAARIGATPDFFAIDPDRQSFGVLQVKTTDERTFRKIWRVPDQDDVVEPPLFIAIQAIIEATLTGASWAYVAVMVSGSNLDLWLISVPIHAGIMTRLRTEVADFWRHVADGEPPQADYGRDAEVLAALYRDSNGQEIDLRADNHLPELLAERDQLKAEIRARGTRVAEIDTELKARMGAFDAALIAGGRRLTWRNQTSRNRFVFATESRVFRVSAARH